MLTNESGIQSRSPFPSVFGALDGLQPGWSFGISAHPYLQACIYPSLLQLQGGISELEDAKQKAVCEEHYKKKVDQEQGHMTEVDLEREQECGICMEPNSKIALPGCNHVMCLKCYREWHARSQSCPFCRDSLKRVNSRDLWIFTDSSDVQDMVSLARDNLQRLFMYIDKLPLLVYENIFTIYDAHVK
ncbi:hypothetical protein BDL97_11G026100 [Sphagnum fallax]|nr:hypothetical protein BDL97_11G026100 [Sphagnum fallax]